MLLSLLWPVVRSRKESPPVSPRVASHEPIDRFEPGSQGVCQNHHVRYLVQICSPHLGDMTPYRQDLANFIVNASPKESAERAQFLMEFVKDVTQLRECNRHRLKNGEHPISFCQAQSEIALKYLPCITVPSDAKLNAFMMHMLDTAAPQIAQDTDHYSAFYQTDHGPLQREADAVVRFSARMRHADPKRREWYDFISYFGSRWNQMRQAKAEQQIDGLAQSAQWFRQKDGSLIRRVALSRMGEPRLQYREIPLNLKEVFGEEPLAAEEAQVMRALSMLANFEHTDRPAVFDDRVAPTLRLPPAKVAVLKEELLVFLSRTEIAHAEMVLGEPT